MNSAPVRAAKLVLAVVLGFGWAMAGWRNMPRLEQPQASAAGLAIACSVGLAYWAGTRRKRDAAVAVAVAQAEAHATAVAAASLAASQHVHVVVDNSQGARAQGSRQFGIEDAPWIVSHETRAEIESEALDVALEDVLDEREKHLG